MPIKKITTRKVTPKKDALKKLTVPALRAKAKRAGIKLSKTDGSPKTKAQLILALDKMPTPRKKETTRKPSLGRKPASTKQTGTTNFRRDAQRQAEPPGKRLSKNEHVYYERRKNRSDITQSGQYPLMDKQYGEEFMFTVGITYAKFLQALKDWYKTTDRDITEKLLDVPEILRTANGLRQDLQAAIKVLNRYDAGIEDDDFDPYEDD